MRKNPVVSVIMPVYNSRMFLKEAVESILAQSYNDFELIIIDDGSTDGSSAVLDDYRLKDQRIKVIFQDHQGLIAALNRGLQASLGKYIARLDADDVALPNRLERQVRAMEASKKIAIMGSGYFVIDGHGAVSRVVKYPLTNTRIRWTMLFNNSFAHSSIIIRTEFLREHGLAYDKLAEYVEDYELWSRVVECGQAINLPDPLIKYRLHGQQGSAVNSKPVKEKSDWVSVRNIRKLGVIVTDEDVRVLRAWNHHFPRHLRQEDIKRCELLLQIHHAFSLIPGIDLSVCQKIKGYFLFRIIAASIPGQTKAVWQKCLSRYLGIGDMPSIFFAGMSKLFQIIKKPERIADREG